MVPVSRTSWCLLLFCCLVLVGCSAEQLGIPRVQIEVRSPSGGHVARVSNHPSIDPPSQSLWVQTQGGDAVQVRRLAEDQDWCDTIVWSADSTRVAFLVQDAYLVLVDAFSGQVVFERWLIEARGAYPPHEVVEDLLLSEDGSMATFKRCSRRSGTCSEPETLVLAPRE